VAVVEAHPTLTGGLVLRNVSSQPWSVRPEHEQLKTVAPAQRLGVRPMRIDFGAVEATIDVPA